MYIGEKKVENIDNNLATLEDGTIVALTDKQLTYMVTEEPVDATTSRDLMLFSIVPDMMEILRIHNVKKVDIQAVLNATVGEYNDQFNKAVGKAFSTYEEGKHSAFFPENIRMSDIDKFL